MCESNLQIHFCTCDFKHIVLGNEQIGKWNPEMDDGDYLRTQSIWILKKFLGEKDLGRMGTVIGPSDKLNEELTAEYICAQLNKKDCFDFNYSPAFGDNIEIRQSYKYPTIKKRYRPGLFDYLSFIFRKGNWEIDYYNVFYDRTRQLKKGVVEILKT